MALRLQIDPGGEPYLQYAKNKLRQMQEYMRQVKIGVFTKRIVADNGVMITLNSSFSGKEALDKIRIEAGGGYLSTVFLPDAVQYNTPTTSTGDVTYGPPPVSIVNVYDYLGNKVDTFTGFYLIACPYVYQPAQNAPNYITTLLTTYNPPVLTLSAYNNTSLAAYNAGLAAQFPGTNPPQLANTWPDGGGFTWQSNQPFSDGFLFGTGWLTADGITAMRKEERKARSALLLSMLRNNSLPVFAMGSEYNWASAIKSCSGNFKSTQFISQLSAALVGSEILVDYPSAYTDITQTRSVKVSYVDANGEIQTQLIEGTWRSAINADGRGRTDTFVNFPAFDVDTGAILQALSSSSLAGRGAFLGEGPRADAGWALASVLDGYNTYSIDASVGTSAGSSSISGMVVSSTLTCTVAALYLQYMQDIGLLKRASLSPIPDYSPNWMSTGLVPGEIVSLVPFSPVLDGEDLGIFGDRTAATRVALYGVAQAKYAVDGSLVATSWADKPRVVDLIDAYSSAQIIAWEAAKFVGVDTSVLTKAQLAALLTPSVLAQNLALLWGSLSGSNAVVKFTKFYGTDMDAAIAAQKKFLAAPVGNANIFLAFVKKQTGL